MICEWISGQLGIRLGLPIAPFEMVSISAGLLSISLRSDLPDLGAGTAFGSRKLPVVELSVSHLDDVPDELQRDVLVFDWWIRNADRSLGEAGGNPNLFWDFEQEGLAVIDHNQAFDRAFSVHDFSMTHAFRNQIPSISGDWVLQQQYCQRFAEVVTEWQSICDTIPPEWWFVDPEKTVPTDFDLEETRELLLGYHSDKFWSFG